eukprot:TRINITY_DN46974_c0_g1_i1.p1 TRINITY_DN46974_c0_g1~~TRINITY_DN46974_c0_g1_i1.p1  ORF type:complete len:233 (+),score=35.24 TRINITY_DN46974_c0_g1_i1:81-779(+)
MDSESPVDLHYFPSRGRGEPIRLLLALKGIDWNERGVPSDMKTDPTLYPFGQIPRYVDAEVDLVQSNAILRHLGRKHGLYGVSLMEAAAIDSLADGLEDMRAKTKALVYQDKFSDDAMSAYQADVLSEPQPGSGGKTAMFTFERLIVGRCCEGQPFYCSSGVTIADLLLMNAVDIHLPLFPVAMEKFPALLAHHARVQALPPIAEYLRSQRRLGHFWGSDYLAERKGEGFRQ